MSVGTFTTGVSFSVAGLKVRERGSIRAKRLGIRNIVSLRLSHISTFASAAGSTFCGAFPRFAYAFPSLREPPGDAAIAMAVLDLPSATGATKQTSTVSKVPAPLVVRGAL